MSTWLYLRSKDPFSNDLPFNELFGDGCDISIDFSYTHLNCLVDLLGSPSLGDLEDVPMLKFS